MTSSTRDFYCQSLLLIWLLVPVINLPVAAGFCGMIMLAGVDVGYDAVGWVGSGLHTPPHL